MDRDKQTVHDIRLLQDIAHRGFTELLKEDENSRRYTAHALRNTANVANEGENRVILEDVKKINIAEFASKIENGETDPSVNFWIGFIERVGGPSFWSHQYRKLQNEITEANMGLVWSRAHAAGRSNAGIFDVEDFANEGYLGLRYAVELFLPSMGFKFSTYAISWIKQHICRYIMKNKEAIRRPEAIIRAEMLERRNGDKKKQYGVLSLSDFSEDHDYELGIHNPPERPVENHDEEDRIDTMLMTLSPREAQVIKLRFGLKGGPALRLQDVGEIMGVCRERVRQLEARAIKKLKAMGNPDEA